MQKDCAPARARTHNQQIIDLGVSALLTELPWLSYILHKNLFYTKVNGVSTKSLCRIERLKPDWNFPEVWASVRMASLPSHYQDYIPVEAGT